MQDLENDKFNSLELGSGDLFEGEALAGLDGKACERLITQNKKKARKVNDALNSNHEIWSWKSLTKATPQSQSRILITKNHSRKPNPKANLENQSQKPILKTNHPIWSHQSIQKTKIEVKSIEETW
jgi:hypothetical protein